MPGWVIQVVVAIALAVLSYVISPKPKKPSAPKAQEIDIPTVDAGRSIPVVFGRVRVKSPNLVWMGGLRSEEIKR